MNVEPDLIGVALQVVAALEDGGVPYVAGGSVASSVCGEPRSTQDVDLVVFLSEAQIDPFLAGLGVGFYADSESARRAVREQSSFNVIHEKTGTKVDLFVRRRTSLDEEQMRRRVRVKVASDPDRYLFVYTPEDILLQNSPRGQEPLHGT